MEVQTKPFPTMGTKKFLLFVVWGLMFCLAGLSIDTQASGGRAQRDESPAEPLAGVKHLALILEFNDAHAAMAAGLSPAEVQKVVKQKLLDSGVKVVDELDPLAAQIPPARLSINVILTRLKLPDLYGYYVQTALWDRAQLQKGAKIFCFARLWQAEQSNIQTATEKTLSIRIKKTALKHVDEFVKAYLAANQRKDKKTKVSNPAAALPGLTKKSLEKSEQQAKAEYEYVASKNSKTFHKSDCSSAKRILPKNLVGFSNKDEALKTARRPCKRCKP